MTYGKPVFLYENLLKQHAVTVTSEDVNYPKENLFDDQQGSLWKPTSSVDQYITIDAGAAVSVDAFCLGNTHNLNTVNAAVTLQYSNDNFAANVVNAFAGFIPSSDNSYQFKLFSAVSARYWRIKLSGITTGSIPQIGQAAFGTSFTLPWWFDGGHDKERHIKGATNISGGGRTESITFFKRNVFPCTIAEIVAGTQEETDMLVWRDAVEEGMPFWFFRDMSGTYELYFVNLLEKTLKAPISELGARTFSFTLQEEL